MTLEETYEYEGKNVEVICTDGDIVTGLLWGCEDAVNFDLEEDAIEIYKEEPITHTIEIPVSEIAKIIIKN